MTLKEITIPTRNSNAKEKKRWYIGIKWKELGFKRLRSKRFKFGEERLIDKIKHLSN